MSEHFSEEAQQLVRCMASRSWRLSSLYYITDKSGRHVHFTPNWAQAEYLREMWCLNIILKARQLGFTTFCCLLFLDACVFNSNVRAGIIAHTKEDAATFFKDKIKYAYEHLPPAVREACPVTINKAGELGFANGSSIRVSTSFRSGTLQYLHVSEFGKICAQRPDRAREIVTGAFNAVETGQSITIESTAEGRQGYFFDYCQQAQALAQAEKPLTELDFKFHFFPWWRNPAYTLEQTAGVVLSKDDLEYFSGVEAYCRTTLSAGQRAWYVKKRATLGEDIKREYPGTPDEAFEQAIIGAYFTKEFIRLRERKRITAVSVREGLPVHTAWDLGMNDTNCIWFVQVVGRELHIVDYYENSGEGLKHYITVLGEKGHTYGRHFAPHDIEVRELGTGKSRKERAAELGIVFETVPRVERKSDSIEAARKILPDCWFDESACAVGLRRLEHYRKQWDDRHGCYRNNPLHDENSNGADAFQTLAMSVPDLMGTTRKVKAKQVVRKRGWA